MSAAIVGWTLIAFGFLVFEPGFQPTLLACMHQVGRSATCEAGQAAINDAWWWLHLAPLWAAVAAGYLAIVIARIRRRRDRL